MFSLWHTSRRQTIAVIGGQCRSRADNLQRDTVEDGRVTVSTRFSDVEDFVSKSLIQSGVKHAVNFTVFDQQLHTLYIFIIELVHKYG